RRVEERRLCDQDKWALRRRLAPRRFLRFNNLLERTAQMDRPRFPAFRRIPRDRSVETPINLEHAGTVCVIFESSLVTLGKTFACNMEELTRRQIAKNCGRFRQIIQRG